MNYCQAFSLLLIAFLLSFAQEYVISTVARWCAATLNRSGLECGDCNVFRHYCRQPWKHLLCKRELRLQARSIRYADPLSPEAHLEIQGTAVQR